MDESKKPNDCCKLEGNLHLVESTMSRSIYECKQCGLRHYEFMVEPSRSLMKFK